MNLHSDIGGSEIAGQCVLVVDDDEPLRRAIIYSLQGRNRTFFEAENGQQAIVLAVRVKPDLIVTDYLMPEMNGIELVKRLRDNPFTAHTPIIMVSAVSDPQERINMIRAGVDDCVQKPFHPDELAARADMIIARCARELSTDSLTRLPGNAPTREQIERRLDRDQPFKLCYADLDQFKPFVDHYGYERASRVVATVARILERAVREAGSPADFVGHIGGDDFVLLVAPDRAAAVCEAVLRLFAERVPEFYDEEDREQGHIVSHDRDGHERRFDLMTLTIAVVDSVRAGVKRPAELADLVARAKAEAKARPGNVCLEFNE